MSKKSFILFIILILVVLGITGWYMFLRSEVVPVPGNETADDGSDLFPFGRKPADTKTPGGLVTDPNETNNNSTVDLGGPEGEEMPKLRQISTVPAAGIVAFDVGSTTLIRYIERATGHIYETASDKETVKKISNTTIPKIHEVLWANDGSKLVIRYIKDDTSTIRSFYARISTTTRPEQAIEGIFLADDIRELSIAGTKLFYMTETSAGSNGILANLDGSSRTSVFSSSFSDWRSSLVSPATAVIFSRPSGTTDGAAYLLNTNNGSYTKVASGAGLVALANADGSRVLASATTNRAVITLAYNVKEGSSENLAIQTIADKCVWSVKNKTVVYCAVPQTIPNATYPDDWYQGQVSFNDALWKIDTASGETEELFTPELEAGVSMDIFKLSINPREDMIVFTNKKNMTVWSYSLK